MAMNLTSSDIAYEITELRVEVDALELQIKYLRAKENAYLALAINNDTFDDVIMRISK